MQRYKLNKEAYQAKWLKLKDWWNGLALREQRAVAIGGMTLALFILYQGIWSPILGHITSMRQQIVKDQKTLAWMKSTDRAISVLQKESHASQKSGSPVVLLSAFQNNMQQAGFEANMVELKQSGNQSIAVKFQKVSFDKWIKAVVNFTQEHQVVISNMAIDADAVSGVVNVDLVMQIDG